MQSWSYWEKEKYINNDILIVGAGIVGLFSAYYLAEKFPSKKIAVLERHSLAAGASTKNAGFACFGSVTEMADDLINMDQEELISLIKMRWEGLQRMRSIISDLDLHYQSLGGYEVFDDETQYRSYKGKIEEFNQLVQDACGLENCFAAKTNESISGLYTEMIYNQYEGQLNPINLVSKLRQVLRSMGVHFIPGVGLEHWESKDRIKLKLTNGESIFTEKLVLATNAFTQKFFPSIALTPYRNQVLVTEPIVDLQIKGCYHYNKGYTYFRNIGNRMLIGGFRNLAMEEEQTTAFGLTSTIQEALEAFVKSRLGLETKVAHRWSGILASGPKKSAIIKEVEENVFLGVRLGGMGVAIGSEVAHQLSLMVN